MGEKKLPFWLNPFWWLWALLKAVLFWPVYYVWDKWMRR